jgi:hypothetical protein
VTARRAVSGAVNTFSVDIVFQRLDMTTVHLDPRTRDFFATGFSGSCGPSGLMLAGYERRPLAALMPRYYKLTVDVHALPAPAQGEPLLLGGLLARAPVYLAYDVNLSTPGEPVWRDINLPASAGSWTLRVRARGNHLAGELVLQRLSERQVYPPLVLRCGSWNLTGYNFLAADPAACSGAGALAVAVLVEPA